MMGVGDLSNTLAWVMSMVILVIALTDARRSLFRLLTGRTVVFVAVLLWYMLEAIRLPRDYAKPTIWAYSQTEYNIGLAVVALALIMFLIGYHYSRLNIFDDIGRRLVRLDNDNILWTMFLLGCVIGLAPMIYYADFHISVLFDGIFGVHSRWSWKLARGRLGDLRAALLELQMFLGAVIPFATVILFSPRTSALRRGICLFFITWMLLRANASGTRSSVIPIVMPIAGAIFWKSSRDIQQWLILLGLPAAIVAGYAYSVVIVNSRNSGEVEFEQTVDNLDEYTGFEMFRELLFVLDKVPDSVDYQLGKSYLNQMINPIPRYFWEGKPVDWDAGIILARAKGYVDETGRVTMTNSPGFIGETYLNFGFLGVILIPLISGFVIRAWDRLFDLCGQSFLVFTVFAAGLSNILASGRSISISTYYGMIALYLLLIFLETFFGTRRQDTPAERHALTAREAAA